ncbi:aa3-type cytochrome c oxidase subunit IV [Cucumibacter marinus]|uniref:aa3-type cytochrome c oxidase subunit IV n=1 Tax=Cucumibacter marinus TaxID=1121252 RepID=UPI00040CC6DE|nr:aa3-type cytochrome c oxidase subunit IV [Cucumibacter marinus]
MATNNAADFSEHENTFNLFIGITKWSIGLIAAALLTLYFGLVAGNGALAILTVLATIAIVIGIIAFGRKS